MPDINKTKVVAYRPEQMYELVNRVEDYSQFIPWCTGSDVLSRDEDEVHATLHFSASGMTKSFTTCNRLQPHKMIEIRLIQGPFRHLDGFWRFDPVSEHSSQVTLDLEFEFSNKLLSLAFGPVFNQVASTLVDAFSQRAEQVYGKNPS